jgi:hypothetical protein
MMQIYTWIYLVPILKRKLDPFGKYLTTEQVLHCTERKCCTDSCRVQQSDTALSPLRQPDSNAFVDINGDCLSDLFVTSTCSTPPCNSSQFEIWINEKGTFKLDKVLPAVAGAGQVSFADIGKIFTYWV